MPRSTSSNPITRTAAFKRYIRSIDRLIANTSASGQVHPRHLEAVSAEARVIGKRQIDVIADLKAITQRNSHHDTLAAARRWETIMALFFSLVRRHDKQNPDAPLMRSARAGFQQDGTYASLARLRDRAEQAHKELATLANRHPDLPILKPTPRPVSRRRVPRDP